MACAIRFDNDVPGEPASETSNSRACVPRAPRPRAPCLGRLNCLNDSTGAAMAGMSNEAQYSFGIRTPGDLLLKLRREIASLLKNPDSSDAAIHLIIAI